MGCAGLTTQAVPDISVARIDRKPPGLTGDLRSLWRCPSQSTGLHFDNIAHCPQHSTRLAEVIGGRDLSNLCILLLFDLQDELRCFRGGLHRRFSASMEALSSMQGCSRRIHCFRDRGFIISCGSKSSFRANQYQRWFDTIAARL